MPIYDYKCDSCDNEFEEMHLIANRHTPVDNICDQCGEGKIKMKTVAPGIGDPLKMGLKKPDGQYVEKLKEIKKNHPLGTVSSKDYW